MAKQTPEQQVLAGLHSNLTEVRDHVVKVLNENNFSMLAITALTKFDQIINMIGHSLGQGTFTKPAETIEFPPVTNFMGTELTQKEKVTEEILSPKEYAVKKFAEDVDKLAESYPNRTDEDILDAHSLQEHQIILRGVAKRAGLEDFKTGKIDLDFVTRTREGLIAKEKEAQEQDDAEDLS